MRHVTYLLYLLHGRHEVLHLFLLAEGKVGKVGRTTHVSACIVHAPRVGREVGSSHWRTPHSILEEDMLDGDGYFGCLPRCLLLGLGRVSYIGGYRIISVAKR